MDFAELNRKALESGSAVDRSYMNNQAAMDYNMVNQKDVETKEVTNLMMALEQQAKAVSELRQTVNAIDVKLFGSRQVSGGEDEAYIPEGALPYAVAQLRLLNEELYRTYETAQRVLSKLA